MTHDKTGGPAFPSAPDKIMVNENGIAEPFGFRGMTLRDWFAGKALAPVMADLGGSQPDEGETWADMIARMCYEIADEMIAARGDT